MIKQAVYLPVWCAWVFLWVFYGCMMHYVRHNKGSFHYLTFLLPGHLKSEQRRSLVSHKLDPFKFMATSNWSKIHLYHWQAPQLIQTLLFTAVHKSLIYSDSFTIYLTLPGQWLFQTIQSCLDYPLSPTVRPSRHSPRPSPSQCALLCWELPCWGRGGGGGVAAALQWCQW